VSGDRRLPEGFAVGHWTDSVGRTGCTAVIAGAGAVGGVDVRGAAPATLATDTLRPATLVDRVHAVLLTGGSAFGLHAAAGVMGYLEQHGIGFELASVRVPIVAGAAIFDLSEGDSRARPDSAAGYAACEAATDAPAVGAVGGGTGATVAKGGDRSEYAAGGFGVAAARVGPATVTAVMVVNSVGGIWDDDRHDWVAPLTNWDRASGLIPGANTTIGAVLTDATVTCEQANRIATVGHDGMARAIRPAHTMYDGDTLFCMATGTKSAPYDAVEAVAADVVAKAIVAGVRAASP
jgi:L-aminopeptidase/D-esterase-like protein